MIGRRRFLAASAAGALTGGLAAAAPALARSVERVSIGETFVPEEWRTAFEASLAGVGNAADLAFWRRFSARGGRGAAP